MEFHRRSTLILVLGSAALAAIILSVTRAYADNPPKSPVTGTGVAKLHELAWMQGTWIGDHNGDRLEEVWSAPSGDSLMGMFRWIKEGNVWMFELITITAEDHEVVLRLKHFDRRMVGWEEKDEALTCRLVRQRDREAVFEDPKRDHPRRFVYRLDGDNRLTIRLEGEEDGESKSTTLVFNKE